MQVKELRIKARKLGSCSLFTGKESEEELSELAFSPQGIEFCTGQSFPTAQQVKEVFTDPARFNIYADAGFIVLDNVGRCYLIGDTQATINITDSAHSHEVVALNGARATVHAFGYSVVFGYKDLKSDIKLQLNDKAFGKV